MYLTSLLRTCFFDSVVDSLRRIIKPPNINPPPVFPGFTVAIAIGYIEYDVERHIYVALLPAIEISLY
jgi:hypothetical protein